VDSGSVGAPGTTGTTGPGAGIEGAGGFTCELATIFDGLVDSALGSATGKVGDGGGTGLGDTLGVGGPSSSGNGVATALDEGVVG
jgi:hypothetical protein